MTAPRRIVRGATYLFTRRCAHRQFLLRPSDASNATFLYVFAVAARRFNIRVHAYCVLSNHVHIVLTDPDACLPAFAQYLGSLVARAVNASLGRWESLWAPGSYSAVALQSPADVIDKAAYVLANPVAAGLVDRGRRWPGLWSAPSSIGGAALVAKRPAGFFRTTGFLPDAAELQLVAPPGFTACEFRERLEAALTAREEEARSRQRTKGPFLGARRVLEQKPTARPRGAEPRRGLNPRVGSRDKWKRIEAQLRLADFMESYRKALRARRDGEPHLFPEGTYLMRVMHNVACAPG